MNAHNPYPGPQADPMVEDYLRKLNGKLIFLKGKARQGIMAETRGHLYQMLSEYPDPEPAEVQHVLAGYGDPSVLAREYKELHGYSIAFTFALGFVGFFIALFSIPFIMIPAGASALAFLMVVGLTLLASWKFGKMSGVAVGLTAALVRIFGVAILNGLAGTNEMLVMDGGAMGAVVLSSLLLIVIGYAPGRSLEKWEARKAEDFELF
jgi:hypothetical protein